MIHEHSLERYSVGDSRIHSLEPRVKVMLTLLAILAVVTLPDGAWLVFGLAWLLVLVLNLLAELGPAYSFKRSFVALPFALAAITIIFTLPGRPVLTFTLGPWQFQATDAGLLRFSSIMIRSWIAVQMAILLTATTRFPDLLHALRHLYMPPLIVAIISFMYRYITVLADETQRLMRARESRSAGLEGRRAGGSLAWRARVVGNMAGQLFLRSYERSERIYSAMQARGFAGEFLTLNPHIMRQSDWLAVGLGLAILFALAVLGRLV